MKCYNLLSKCLLALLLVTAAFGYRQVAPDSTDVSVYFVMRHAITGAPTAGLTGTSIDIYYMRERGVPVLVTTTTTGTINSAAHADNKITDVNSGWYRADIADTAFATGSDSVMISLIDTTSVCYTSFETIDLSAGGGGDCPTEAEIADAVWDEILSSGHSTVNSAADYLADVNTLAELATPALIADAVWDELLHFGHSTTNSAAYYLSETRSNTGVILADTGAVDTADELRTLLTGTTSPLSILRPNDNIGINWNDVNAPTSTVALTNTTISGGGGGGGATAQEVRAEMDVNSTKLQSIDRNTSTR